MADPQQFASQRIEYVGSSNERTSAKDPGQKQTDPVTIGFTFAVNDKQYVFVPDSVINKGVQSQNYQFYIPAVLDPSFQNKLQSAQPIAVEDLSQKIGGDTFVDHLSREGFDDKKGYMFPKSVFDSFKNASGSVVEAYKIGFVGQEGVSTGAIQGLGVVNGRPVYVADASGRGNAQSYVYYDPTFKEGKSSAIWQQWNEPGEKWYESTLGKVGIALIAAGTAGLALGAAPAAGAGAGAGAAGGTAAGAGAGAGAAGSAAGGTAAAGTGLTVGAGGATGLTAGAAGATGVVAPSGFVLAPSVGAGVGAGTAAAVGAGTGGGSSAGGTGLLDTAQFGQTGQTGITPGAAGQGLQTPTTPGLSSMGGGTGVTVPVSGGTVSQLGMVPTGATPVLGDPKSFINDPNVLGNTVFTTDTLLTPGAATGMSASDALRLANQARGLLGAGQNPIIPQQQGLPQSGRSKGVDYSGLLSLLQLQARTPGVSSLTAPAQLRQMYQPTLLPNVLSLLG